MADVSINKILSHIQNNNPLLPNKFKITVTGPEQIGPDIMFNCHTVDIPGRSLATEEYYVHGPVKKVPYMETYDDVTTTFYLSDNLQEHTVFHKWMNKIGGDGQFFIGYYSDMVGKMRIDILDRGGNITNSVDVYDCYPTGISALQLSYGAEQIAELTVTWSCYIYDFV